MSRFGGAAALSCLLALASGAAEAQSSLGITGLELAFGHVSGDAASTRTDARLDVALTGAHGLQLDLSLSDTDGRSMGMAAAHLYMTPQPGQKYGLFASLTDQDGHDFTFAAIGAEGRLALSDRVTVEAHAGLGYALGGDLDAIFAGGAARWQATDRIALRAGLDLVEYDETSLSAMGYTAAFVAEVSVTDRVDLVAGVEATGRTGRDDLSADPAAFVGLTIRFGGAADPVRDVFRSPDPLRPLWDRPLR
jgi:hypothetical protein